MSLLAFKLDFQHVSSLLFCLSPLFFFFCFYITAQVMWESHTIFFEKAASLFREYGNQYLFGFLPAIFHCLVFAIYQPQHTAGKIFHFDVNWVAKKPTPKQLRNDFCSGFSITCEIVSNCLELDWYLYFVRLVTSSRTPCRCFNTCIYFHQLR